MLLMQATVDDFTEVLDLQEGKQFWTLTTSGNFSTFSAYEAPRGARVTLASRRLIWDRRLPCKVTTFMWQLLNDYLPFPEALCKLGFHIPSKCLFCPSEETKDHVLSDCPFASAIWRFFSQAFQLPGFSSMGVQMRLQHWWSNASFTSARGLMLMILPSIICWEIWKVRNHLFHQGGTACHVHVCRQIQLSVLSISQAFPFVQATSEDSSLVTLGLVSRLSQSKP